MFDLDNLDYEIVFEKQVNSHEWKQVAKIRGKYYPHYFSNETGKVTWGKWFAPMNANGIVYVSAPFRTLRNAKRAF